MKEFETAIRDFLSEATGVARGEIHLEIPKNRQISDIAFPCFILAKNQGKNPAALAAELAKKWKSESIQVKAEGPYLNFTIERRTLAQYLLQTIPTLQGKFGSSNTGAGKNIVIDYSSPNIAKPFGVGHLRSTVIGAAIKRLLEFQGYPCIGINHLGDWGMQFGRMLAAVKRYDPKETFAQSNTPSKNLLDLYVRIHQDEEQNPQVKEEARQWFLKLEGRDPEAKRLWELLVQVTWKEFEKIYQILGVSFEKVQGESFYEDKLGATLERIQKTGVTSISEGALIIDLEEKKMPPCILKTGEGTTLYATRDLAALFYRYEQWNFHKALYVVGSDQRLHFRQLKEALLKMGFAWADNVVHVDFGMMRLKEGKMSTRKGRVVFLEEVLEKAVEMARQIIEEKNPDLPDKDKAAQAIGVGAVIFNDLKNGRIKDVLFDWDVILNFDGETGPYVQYTHARLSSILRKYGKPVSWEKVDPRTLEDAGELLVMIARFPQYAAKAAEEFEPSILTNYVLELAKSVNLFYRERRVLGEEEKITQGRIALIEAARSVLETGLGLLGIQALHEM